MEVEKITAPCIEAIFEEPKFDNSVFSRTEVEILESQTNSNLSAVTTRKLKFEFKSKDNMRDIHESCFRMEGRIVKDSDLSDYAVDDQIMLVSPASLIQRATLKINNVVIEDNTNVPIRSLLLDVLEYRNDDLGRQDNEWIYLETSKTKRGEATRDTPATATSVFTPAGGPYTGSTITVVPGVLGNTSAMKRYARTSRRTSAEGAAAPVVYAENPSNAVEFDLPLSRLFGYIRDNPALIVSQLITIDIILADKTAGLVKRADGAGALADGRFVLSRMSLWSYDVTPRDTDKIYRRMAANEKITRMWTDHRVYPCVSGDIGQLEKKYTLGITSLYSKIGRVYVVAVASEKLANNQLYNQGMFDRLNITSAQVLLNDKPVPQSHEYELNFPEQQFQRVYKKFLEAASASHADDGEVETAIDYDTFKQAYPILCFDLHAVGQTQIDKTSLADIKIKFSMQDSTIRDAYGTKGAAGETYRVYGIVEVYRDAVIGCMDGAMVFESVSG